MEFSQLEKIIKEEELLFSDKRTTTLFTLSIISITYAKTLESIIGVSSKIFGGLGEGDLIVLIGKTNHFAQETKKFLERCGEGWENRIFEEADKNFLKYEDFLSSVEKVNNSPFDTLREILEVYPKYSIDLATYNVVWKMSNLDWGEKLIPKEAIDRIGIGRNKIASIYPRMDQIVKNATEKIGEDLKIDGDFLRYLTFNEMRDYLAGKLNIFDKLTELENRKKGYFYLYFSVDDSELINIDVNILKQIRHKYFKKEENVREFSGKSVFPGKISGNVVMLPLKDPNIILPQKFVLIATMTNPSHFSIAQKSSAIVTDEGGILCHAAILAREFKIPCVVGTKIATANLKDGDMVEVDANNGVVKILNEKA